MMFASFSRTLGFAAAAALAAPFALALLRPVVGFSAALPVFVIGVVALYAAGLARRPSIAIAAAAAVALPGMALLGAGGSAGALFLLCAVTLGVLRSGLLQRDARTGFARAFAIEAGLVAAGLALAQHLAGGAFFPISLAVWGCFLVQSAFFLIGGNDAREARQAVSPEADGFEQAALRARRLLDATPLP